MQSDFGLIRQCIIGTRRNARTHAIDIQNAVFDIGIAGFDAGGFFNKFGTREGVSFYFARGDGIGMGVIVFFRPGIVGSNQLFVGDSVRWIP